MNKLDEEGDDFRDAPMAALYEVSRSIYSIYSETQTATTTTNIATAE